MNRTVRNLSILLAASLAGAPVSPAGPGAQAPQDYEPLFVTTKAWGPDGLVDKAIPTITFGGPWQSTDTDFGSKEIKVVSLLDTADAEVFDEQGNADVSASMPWRSCVQMLDMHNVSIGMVARDLDQKVGETVAANLHGRGPGAGPIINIIRNFSAFNSGGRIAKVERQSDPEGDFFMVPGNFNSLAVVNKVNFALVENGHIRRETSVMPAKDYPAFFEAHVRGDMSARPRAAPVVQPLPAVALHEAVLYAPRYDVARAVSWLSTDKSLTHKARLVPWDTKGRTWFADLLGWCVLHLRWGASFRRYVADPLFYFFNPVVLHNFALSGGAGYVLDLDPASHPDYATHEYYVPTDKFEPFRAKLASVLERHRVEVLNVTVQFSPAEKGSMMPWAKTDVFAFCVTYRGSGDPTTWSQELIDAAIALGGSFDLASQMKLASVDEILGAYPGTVDFLASKFLNDNLYRFHNALIDKLCPVEFYEAAEDIRNGEIKREDAIFKGYRELKVRAHEIDLFHLAGIRSASEIPERRGLLAKISEANDLLLNTYQAGMKKEQQVSDMKARHMPDYLIEAFAREWYLMDHGIEPYEIDIRTTERRFIELTGEMLDLAERNWGHWRADPDGGNPKFDDPGVASAYQALSDEMTQAVQKMNGDIDAMDSVAPMYKFHYQ
jgi:hypothetical protein